MHPDFIEYVRILATSNKERGIPNVSATNGQFLADMILATSARTILELGTANGYSTLWLASAAQQNNGHVTTVDRDVRMIHETHRHIEDMGLAKVCTVVEQEVISYLDALDPSVRFDFVFIDAMKRETLEYFTRVYPHVAEHGVVIVDDVIKFRAKMEDFFGYIAREGIHATILPIDADDGVAMIVKQ